MSSSFGNKVKIQIFGQSHSKGLGVIIDGLPSGEGIDMAEVNRFLQLRAGGKNRYSTQRKESDEPIILSGLIEGKTCGAPLCAIFENKNTKSSDYNELEFIPRPSHADFTAFIKHNNFNDKSGGGHFSGRLTLPLCFAGAVCKQILEKRKIFIGAHISSIGNIKDTPYNPVSVSLCDLKQSDFPVLNNEKGEEMQKKMIEIAEMGDSIGGTIECAIIGVKTGFGNPIFDNLESLISHTVFAIPAVKGIEFGAGFAISEMLGSQANDEFHIENGEVKTKTNNSGGILGGISNSMPIIFKTALKPTPSIYKTQKSINLKTGESVDLNIKGRHDPCIVPRAVPCIISAAAIVLCDLIL